MVHHPLVRAVIMIAVCLTGAVAVAAASPKNAAHATSAVDLHKHPTGEETPIEVSPGLYITNLVSIDETLETFEVGGYLALRWVDPRLIVARPQDLVPAVREYTVDELWTPAIEAANSISHKRNSYSLQVDRKGVVNYVERFDAVLSNPYNLRKFPFDTQVLQFEFQPFLSSASDIRFSTKPLPLTGISPDQHLELASWRIQDVWYRTERVAREGPAPELSEGLFQLVIKRRSGFYVWKIFLPLALMTLVPAIVFWIDPKEFDWLLKVPLTMLLSLVAFQFAVARDLPRLGYITFLDAIFIASFVFFFLGILEITAVYLIQKGNARPSAVRLHRSGRWVYPLAYCILWLVLTLMFLN